MSIVMAPQTRHVAERLVRGDTHDKIADSMGIPSEVVGDLVQELRIMLNAPSMFELALMILAKVYTPRQRGEMVRQACKIWPLRPDSSALDTLAAWRRFPKSPAVYADSLIHPVCHAELEARGIEAEQFLDRPITPMGVFARWASRVVLSEDDQLIGTHLMLGRSREQIADIIGCELSILNTHVRTLNARLGLRHAVQALPEIALAQYWYLGYCAPEQYLHWCKANVSPQTWYNSLKPAYKQLVWEYANPHFDPTTESLAERMGLSPVTIRGYLREATAALRAHGFPHASRRTMFSASMFLNVLPEE